jgi:hypothetical protein
MDVEEDGYFSEDIINVLNGFEDDFGIIEK